MSTEMMLPTPEDTSRFCSMKGETTEEKIKIVNALGSPDAKLADQINTEITIKDICIEYITLPDKDGIDHRVPRIIIFDEKGKSYSCVSEGVLGTLKNIISVFGFPTWEPAIKVRVIQEKSRINNVLKLKLV